MPNLKTRLSALVLFLLCAFPALAAPLNSPAAAAPGASPGWYDQALGLLGPAFGVCMCIAAGMIMFGKGHHTMRGIIFLVGTLFVAAWIFG